MAIRINRLSVRTVQTHSTGFHADGGGLYLRVREGGSRAWVFRYTRRGKTREIGLGATHTRTLADARRIAAEMRSLNADGEDPARVVHRDDGPLPSRETFQSCAEELIASKQAGWRNKKHVQQWHNTLRDYVYPMIGRRHPSEITLSHVKAILEPIWATKTETATRVRQRIEAVLDWAYVHELRSGENPARWRGVLDKVLPPPRKVTAVKHLAACPYEEVPAVMHALRGSGHIGAHCLRFLILTATRSGEAREARWDEIDLDQAIWTIPAERIKGGREHRVPLSTEAIEIIKALPKFANQPRLFPSVRGGKLWDVMLMKELQMIREEVTVHGFRSSFRQWAAEQTSFPEAVCELALAHVNRDRVEAAYQRSDLFERRRELMETWCRYLVVEQNVTLLRSEP